MVGKMTTLIKRFLNLLDRSPTFGVFVARQGHWSLRWLEDAHLDQMALDGSSSFIARLRPRSMVHQHATPAHRHHHWHHHHHHRHHHWHQHHHHHGAGWSTNMKSLFIACLWWGQWCFHIWWWRQERSSWCVEFIQPPYTPIREYMGVKPPNLAQWLFFFHLQCGSLAWAH